MTVDEFYEELARVPGEWAVDERFGHIRCSDKLCPILAVAKLRGCGLDLDSYWRWRVMLNNAERLGMRYADARSIAAAADASPLNQADLRHRDRLLETLGLENEGRGK